MHFTDCTPFASFRQQRGVKTSKSQRAEIEDAVDALEAFAPATTTTDALLSATWRLVWTSERETLFLIEKGLAFVGPTGDVLQVSLVLTPRSSVSVQEHFTKHQRQ